MQDDDTVKVIQYADKPQHRKEWAKYAEQIRSSPTRLFITIADECHWGPIACQAHDKMVNDYTDSNPDVVQQDLLECKNHIVLLVSATPFNVLTQNSRLPEKYVVSKPAIADNAKFQRLQMQDVVAKDRSVLSLCLELGVYTCKYMTPFLTA